jgi:hypothetical protein
LTNTGSIGALTASGTGDVITNDGSIGGNVYVDGGTLTNGSTAITSAVISGTVGISHGTLTNFGALGGAVVGADGVLLNGGVGHTSGTILGGVYATGSLATVVNFGTITGVTGVYLQSGSGPLTNGGVITGTGGLAVDFAGGNAHLILDAGAAFNGIVSAGGSATSNVLELAGATGAGTVAGIGTSILNFGTVLVDPGVSWSLAGSDSLAGGTVLSIASGSTLTATGSVVTGSTVSVTGNGVLKVAAGGSLQIGSTVTAAAGKITIDATHTLNAVGTLGSAVVDNGRLNAGAGTLTLTGAASGKGTVGIDASSVLNAKAGLSVATLSFLVGGHETLELGKPNAVTSTLAGFGKSAGNTIDLVGIVGTAVNFSNGVLAVSESGGGLLILKMSGHYTSNQFAIGTDHHGGTNVTFV